MEEANGAGRGFIREELSEDEAGMIIDGDVEELPAGTAGVIVLPVAGDAMAGARDAGELLDIEMDQSRGRITLVAADGRRRSQSGELVGVAAQQA